MRTRVRFEYKRRYSCLYVFVIPLFRVHLII